MKLLKYFSFVLLGGLLFTSCEVDYLESPNEPKVVPTSGLMTRVQKQFMDDTRDEWASGRMTLLWMQYWNQVNYTEEDRFQYRETVNQALWDDIYANALDLKSIIDINTDPELKGDASAAAPNDNQIAAARIMLAYVFQFATDVWGDVPYYSYGSDDPSFNALKGLSDANFSPAYAAQSDIYADILKELDESVAMIDESANMIGGDIFYGGDASKWKKFANSLRLRVANRILGVNPTLAQQHIDDIAVEDVFTSNDDNAGVTYENSALNGAPMYKAFYVENRTDFAPSYSFVELLKGNRGPFGAEDPRLEIYVAPNEDGFYYGVPLTSGNEQVGTYLWESLPGEAVLSAQYTEVYMEYSEVCFIMSELNGWDQTWYENGVRASMAKWGVPEADIQSYIAGLPAASEETVLTQKYIALYMQAFEAWSEYRRTGYPQTLILPGEEYDVTTTHSDSEGNMVETVQTFEFSPIVSLDGPPARVNYLLNEASINKASLNEAISNMGGNEMDTPLWWMQ